MTIFLLGILSQGRDSLGHSISRHFVAVVFSCQMQWFVRRNIKMSSSHLCHKMLVRRFSETCRIQVICILFLFLKTKVLALYLDKNKLIIISMSPYCIAQKRMSLLRTVHSYSNDAISKQTRPKRGACLTTRNYKDPFNKYISNFIKSNRRHNRVIIRQKGTRSARAVA